MKLELYHFKCPACFAEFFLPTRPGVITCTNPSCDLDWAPRTQKGEFQKGVKVVTYSEAQIVSRQAT